MPLVKGKLLADTWRDILTGKREVVVWGVRPNYSLNRWRALLPVKYIVDGNWLLWETKHDGLPVHSPARLHEKGPDRIALISDYDSPDTIARIARFADRHGKIPTLAPKSLPEIYRLLAKSPTRRKGSHAAADLCKNVAPLIKQKQPWHDARPQTPSALKTNISLFSACTMTDVMHRVIPPTVQKGKRTKPQRIVIFGENLGPGGSERQIINLAVGLKYAGYEPVVLILNARRTVPSYVDFLERNGVPLHALMPAPDFPSHNLPAHLQMPAPSGLDGDMLAYARTQMSPQLQFLLWYMPTCFAPQITRMYAYLKTHKPDLVLSYLDWSNVVGAVAGLMAGVPKIIMSGRSLHPGTMPHHYGSSLTEMNDLYRAVLTYPSVSFATNSRNGAKSYASWLGAAPEKIHVIPNCLAWEFKKLTPPKEIAGIRKAYGIAPHAPLIVGAFRYTEEKQPLVFLKTIAAVRRKRPDLRVLICGDGPLENNVRGYIEANKLQDCVILSRLTDKIGTIMAAASLVMLTSNVEGTPNVLLEAQSQQTPVVSTRAGGVEDILYSPLLAYVKPVGDVKGLAQACLELLNDEILRQRLGKEARSYVLKNFSRRKLVERNMAIAE